MDESELIQRTGSPATPRSLARDLRSLGVVPGDCLVVHCALSALGWVAGRAGAVVDALLEVVGAEGTVSMPAHSGDWSDPSGWQNPPVPSAWWPEIVGDRPAFDPYATPLREMGAVAENLLMRRSTLRSAHPLHSHMANGRHASTIVRDHPLEDSFGDASPLGRLYELDAKVLLIGVGHGNNTSLHLAEARAQWSGKRKVEFKSKVATSSGPQHVSWMAAYPDGDDFEALGSYLDECGLVSIGRMGQAATRIMGMRQIVDHAVPWFESNRT
jgi:aminoglycoside 3-N-acetyltransferase